MSHLMIATPAYGGMVQTEYVHSLLNFGYAKIPFSAVFLNNESLITRARNSLLSHFRRSPDYSHLLFLDADVGLPADALRQMLDSGKDVIAAPVALKGRKSNGDRIFNFGRVLGEDEHYWKVDYVGTAVLMLSRRAVDALIADAIHDGRVYERGVTFADQLGPSVHYDIFQVGVVDGVYLSEDFWVCHKLRKLGFDIFVIPDLVTSHRGMISV